MVIFLAYFLVVNESEAFFGHLFKLATKIIPSLFQRKKERSVMNRDLENLFDPYQRNLEMDRLLKQLRNY
uniref:Antimicrobial peptide Meucin-18 n=1 Tax=Mesobuthus eupeus TaxID=34648 RepID=NDBW_MESEU|nr:RecName: Full=Venom antimicrobial peptide-9; AltName: Full=Meucin-18; Flags: Precursor [Mesobuthus eupeus]ABR21067.1 venom antimicrobial peptide-9 [Mesobuthus eupeus]